MRGTKNREHILTKNVRAAVLAHIRENASRKQIYIDRVNGFTDHLHCLFGLNADLTVAKTLQLLKGESAYWINKEGLIPVKFEWANEYYAVSVSESVLDPLRAYIDKQEEPHGGRTFGEEVEDEKAQPESSWLKPTSMPTLEPHHKWWGQQTWAHGFTITDALTPSGSSPGVTTQFVGIETSDLTV